jgi:hypothetical protein
VNADSYADHAEAVGRLLAEHPDWDVVEPPPSHSENPSEPAVYEISLWLCVHCIAGAGGECHSPGCALHLNRAPDLPITVDSTSALIRLQAPRYGDGQ